LLLPAGFILCNFELLLLVLLMAPTAVEIIPTAVEHCHLAEGVIVSKHTGVIIFPSIARRDRSTKTLLVKGPLAAAQNCEVWRWPLQIPHLTSAAPPLPLPFPVPFPNPHPRHAHHG
jgi:hypothetical protein